MNEIIMMFALVSFSMCAAYLCCTHQRILDGHTRIIQLLEKLALLQERQLNAMERPLDISGFQMPAQAQQPQTVMPKAPGVYAIDESGAIEALVSGMGLGLPVAKRQ